MDILTRLMGDTAGPIDSGDAELAIAALLVRVARADGQYDEAERHRIGQVLARRGLTADEAGVRRTQAEALEAEATDTVRFTRQIKDRIALEDRRAVLAALWEVAFADRSRGADEDSLIRLVSSLLGMTDRESAEIRQQVLARMDLEP